MSTARLMSLAAALGTAMTIACGGDAPVSAPQPKPSVMRMLSPNNVFGTAGLKFPVAFEVSLRSADDVPLSNINVLWTVTSGGGVVGGVDARGHEVSGYLVSIPSDANGVSIVAWTLGPVLGQQTLTASVPGFVGSPATYIATGTPP